MATLTFERGNTTIDEEVFNNLEIGLSQENRNTNWQLNAFYNRVDNFIFLSSVDENNDGLANRVDEEGMFEHVHYPKDTTIVRFVEEEIINLIINNETI